eukprot:6178508-Pleurochrysis_carterae.AAC.1
MLIYDPLLVRAMGLGAAVDFDVIARGRAKAHPREWLGGLHAANGSNAPLRCFAFLEREIEPAIFQPLRFNSFTAESVRSVESGGWVV